MIYLLTNQNTKHNVIIVKTTSDLPFDQNQKLNSSTSSYMIDNKIIADISIIPNQLQGNEEEVKIIAKNYFKDYVMRKFEDKDFFASYILYSIHHNE